MTGQIGENLPDLATLAAGTGRGWDRVKDLVRGGGRKDLGRSGGREDLGWSDGEDLGLSERRCCGGWLDLGKGGGCGLLVHL
jgi:hypothetical protein